MLHHRSLSQKSQWNLRWWYDELDHGCASGREPCDQAQLAPGPKPSLHAQAQATASDVSVDLRPTSILHNMLVHQTAYVPGWAVSPSKDQAEVTVEQLNVAKPRRFTLNKKALLFGRVDQVCDVLVSHVSASRVHACLAFDASGKLQVADLGSTHGMPLL